MDKKQHQRYAICAAREVLGIFEARYPADNRPRKAIEAAEKVVKRNTQKNRKSAYTAAAGASLVGADGITGITPTGGSLGGDANVQAMLEGIAGEAVSGNLKSYANLAGFTAAKAGGTYFEAGDLVYLQDINRLVEVMTATTNVVEATDWDYLWDASNVMGGVTFYATMSGAIALDSGAAVVINSDAGTAISDDSGSQLELNADGSVDVHAASGQVAVLATVSGASFTTSSSEADITGTTIDINGALDADGAANDDMSITTSGTGSVLLTGGAEVDLTATLIDINGNLDVDGTTADILASGAFSIDGGSASNVTVTAGALTLGTATSGDTTIDSAGEIYLNDTRTAAIPFSGSGYTTLPGTATSILEALQDAYDNTGDTSRNGYEEQVADSTDAAAEYIISTLADLPATGSFPMSPSALRALTGKRYLAVYLNGLRLTDNEWNYTYASSEKRVTFDGSSDIDLLDGDIVVLDLHYNDSATA